MSNGFKFIFSTGVANATKCRWNALELRETEHCNRITVHTNTHSYWLIFVSADHFFGSGWISAFACLIDFISVLCRKYYCIISLAEPFLTPYFGPCLLFCLIFYVLNLISFNFMQCILCAMVLFHSFHPSLLPYFIHLTSWNSRRWANNKNHTKCAVSMRKCHQLLSQTGIKTLKVN